MFLSCQRNCSVGLIIWPNIHNLSKLKRYYWVEHKSPVKLTQALSELGIRSYSGYGMTEMASTAFAKQSDGKVGVGQPLLGREFKLVNEEVWLKGAGLAMGYWREGHIVPLTNAEGWFQNKR